MRFVGCLLAVTAACGGDDSTCLRVTLTYAGAQEAPVWIESASDTGGYSLNAYPSVDTALRSQPADQRAGVDLCWKRMSDAAENWITTAWLDLEHRAPDSCGSAPMSSPSCAPTSQDPQGTTVAVIRAHELNVVEVDIRDP